MIELRSKYANGCSWRACGMNAWRSSRSQSTRARRPGTTMKTLMKWVLAALLPVPLAWAMPYQGEPLSLNFQDVEVRSVLQVLADYAGVNLVVSDAVQGSVTLRLEDVPWDQALDLVLRSKGLARRQEGNVLLVAPAAEFAAQSVDARVGQALDAQLQPLRRELLPIHHAEAAELAELLLESLADDGNLAGRAA